jgi:hypothetical protein
MKLYRLLPYSILSLSLYFIFEVSDSLDAVGERFERNLIAPLEGQGSNVYKAKDGPVVSQK